MIHFSLSSRNKKTGPIPVSTSQSSTCPDTCSFKSKGCYAAMGKMRWFWEKVDNNTLGMSFNEFLQQIKRLPKSQFWRHNQAGDLAGENNEIDTKKLDALVLANKGRRGFSYTHKPVIGKKYLKNRRAIQKANKSGFTINLSADNLKQADKYYGIAPVVVVLPSDTKENVTTPRGHKVVICPAVTKQYTTCATCQLCQKANRTCIVGFPAHEFQKRFVSEVAAKS